MKAKGELPQSVKAEQPFTKIGGTASYPGEIRPDVVLTSGGKVTDVYDFKFNCSTKGKMSKSQQRRYQKAFGMKPNIIHYW